MTPPVSPRRHRWARGHGWTVGIRPDEGWRRHRTLHLHQQSRGDRQGDHVRGAAHGTARSRSHGVLTDVVLGFKSLTPYEGDHPDFGGTIGRVGNRIAKGKFNLNGQEFTSGPPTTAPTTSTAASRATTNAWERPARPGNRRRRRHASPSALDCEEGYPGHRQGQRSSTPSPPPPSASITPPPPTRPTSHQPHPPRLLQPQGRRKSNVLKHVLKLEPTATPPSMPASSPPAKSPP